MLAESAPIRRRRLSIRTRLALTLTALIVGTGVAVSALSQFTFWLALQSLYGPSAEVDAFFPFGVTAVDMTAFDELEGSGSATTVIVEPGWVTAITVVGPVVLVALAALIGWWIAGRLLRPLHRLSAAAEAASDGDLSHRIRMPGRRDEITDVADRFDTMLEALQRSFEQSERFAANASHELRTPLSTSRAMIDVELRRAGPVRRETLGRLRETNERSLRTVESLLELSRIAAAPQIDTEPADLYACVADAIAERAGDAADDDIEITVSGESVTVPGNGVLVHRLVGNLVGNAVTHNVAGGFVRVEVAEDDGDAVLVVENSGPVLDADVVATLTEPFVRAAARTGRTGAGLGLSIVEAITRRCGGTITLRARAEGGLRVQVRLPVTPM